MLIFGNFLGPLLENRACLFRKNACDLCEDCKIWAVALLKIEKKNWFDRFVKTLVNKSHKVKVSKFRRFALFFFFFLAHYFFTFGTIAGEKPNNTAFNLIQFQWKQLSQINVDW